MKRKITLLLLAASSVLTMNSQVILQEEFTSPFSLTTSGWSVQNLSQPTGTVSWTQGNGTGGNGTSTAYSGGTNDFYCADFFSVPAATAGGISAWLITPNVPIYNGAVLQFATRTLSFTAPNIFPDRMQVRMSLNGSTAIGTTSTAVGTFTNLLLDINPTLSTNNSSVVIPGTPNTVNGYPMAWTVYTIQISGLPSGTVTGKFAFRYFVDNGGQNGTNSRFIGIDQFKYNGPCGTSALSYTTCANQPVTLNATGGLATTTYSWSGPSSYTNNTQAITVNAPASGTAVYTLSPSIGGSVSCGVSQTATVTVGPNLSFGLTATNNGSTICSGTTVTLTATSAAASYLWSNNATTPVITVTPQANTTYSVGGSIGSFPNLCVGGASVTINVIPTPTITYNVNPNPLCVGVDATITSSGASTYTYVVGTQVVSGNPLTIPTAAIPNAALYQVTVFGTGSNGCVAGGGETFSVSGSPTITAATTNTNICPNNTVNITATGAVNYTFAGTGITTSTNTGIYAYGATTGNLVTGLKTFSITGADANGCIGTTQYQVRVYPCTGIESIDGSGNASIFPNPFTNELKVAGMSGSVEVYNALGQLVVKTTVNDAQSINTTDLIKGVYILKAFDKEGDLVKTVKLLKN